MTSQSRQRGSGIKVFVLVVSSGLCLLAIKWWHFSEAQSETAVFESSLLAIQAEPRCPWRQPRADVDALFPGAVRYERETHILSGLRTELSKQLGRAPTGDENALLVYRVYDESDRALGAVLTRRVKGAYGAIELVLGVGRNVEVRGLRLQRHREPDTVAEALQEPSWLGRFVGARADGSWPAEEALASVPAEARQSAQAIVGGVRSMLILLAAAEHQAGTGMVAHH